jgi:hypothetical protein
MPKSIAIAASEIDLFCSLEKVEKDNEYFLQRSFGKKRSRHEAFVLLKDNKFIRQLTEIQLSTLSNTVACIIFMSYGHRHDLCACDIVPVSQITGLHPDCKMAALMPIGTPKINLDHFKEIFWSDDVEVTIVITIRFFCGEPNASDLDITVNMTKGHINTCENNRCLMSIDLCYEPFYFDGLTRTFF